MFEKDKMGKHYEFFARTQEAYAATPSDTETMISALTPIIDVGLQITNKNPMAAGDIESFINDPTIVEVQPKEPQRRNRALILYHGAENLILQLQNMADNSDNARLVEQTRQLVSSFNGTNPAHQVETRLHIMKLLLPVTFLSKEAFSQLTSTELKGKDKYADIFFLRPFNLPDNLIEQLTEIVTKYPLNKG